MNFAELTDEVAARGFDYLSASRLGQFVNWAVAELDMAYCWPYREATQTGAAPLTVSDLGEVDSVTDSSIGWPLERATSSEILEANGDLTTTGTPEFWYTTTGSAVAVYPVTTHSITVRYWKVPPELVSDTDEPLAPPRYHGIYVDLAVRRAYRDSDNAASAADLQAQIDRDIAHMVGDLMAGYGASVVPLVGDDS